MLHEKGQAVDVALVARFVLLDGVEQLGHALVAATDQIGEPTDFHGRFR